MANVALLIDADNVPSTALDLVLATLAELGTVNIRRAYGNWSKQALKSWSDIMPRFGIEPQQQFDMTPGKNATDMRMAIDAMDLLHSGKVDGFGIVSSDCDFMPLATRIRQNGLPVYGFGESKTPEGFRHACTRFINIAAELPVAQTKALYNAKAAPAPPKAKPAGTRKPPNPESVKLLVDAFRASKADQQGFVGLGELGNHAAKQSGFKASNHGYARLSDLLNDTSMFKAERRNGKFYVRLAQ